MYEYFVYLYLLEVMVVRIGVMGGFLFYLVVLFVFSRGLG